MANSRSFDHGKTSATYPVIEFLNTAIPYAINNLDLQFYHAYPDDLDNENNTTDLLIGGKKQKEYNNNNINNTFRIVKLTARRNITKGEELFFAYHGDDNQSNLKWLLTYGFCHPNATRVIAIDFEKYFFTLMKKKKNLAQYMHDELGIDKDSFGRAALATISYKIEFFEVKDNTAEQYATVVQVFNRVASLLKKGNILSLIVMVSSQEELQQTLLHEHRPLKSLLTLGKRKKILKIIKQEMEQMVAERKQALAQVPFIVKPTRQHCIVTVLQDHLAVLNSWLRLLKIIN